MKNVTSGVLYKKVKDSAGNIISQVPVVLRGIASAVFMKDGRTVQEAIESIEQNGTSLAIKEYNTFAEYQADYDAGNIPTGTICSIKE